MSTFGSVDEILDFAIDKEDEATQFYISMANRVEKPWMKQVFKDFAAQEIRHKTKLQQVKEGGELKPSEVKVTDLKIADYLVPAEIKPQMDYQDALTVAMKREKAAFRLYTDLGTRAKDPRIKEAFEALAQEEAKHKLYLELEYEGAILVEN
ncbi:MAG: ferritin family protein [Deltaproteobacteria bacterium]|nr:ferritin family protein [Deltaproteobacteria bacterium]